jgi:hypothetical protein
MSWILPRKRTADINAGQPGEYSPRIFCAITTNIYDPDNIEVATPNPKTSFKGASEKLMSALSSHTLKVLADKKVNLVPPLPSPRGSRT